MSRPGGAGGQRTPRSCFGGVPVSWGTFHSGVCRLLSPWHNGHKPWLDTWGFQQCISSGFYNCVQDLL